MALRPTVYRRNRSVSGVTFVEVMFASLILAVGLMAMMNAWLFSMQMTRTTDETGVAYSLGRVTLEETRKAGYLFTPVGLSQAYFTNAGFRLQDSNGAYFQVTTTVRLLDASVPHLQAKEIQVSVIRLRDSAIVYQTQSFLSLGGP